MKGMGNYAGVNGTNGEVSPRLKGQLSFSSRVPSSLGMLSQISEIGSESFGASGPDAGKLRNGSGDSRFYSSPGFPYGSWNDIHFAENFNGMKRDQDSNGKLFSNTQVSICVLGVRFSIFFATSNSILNLCLILEWRPCKSCSNVIPPLKFAKDFSRDGCHGKVPSFPRFCSL